MLVYLKRFCILWMLCVASLLIFYTFRQRFRVCCAIYLYTMTIYIIAYFSVFIVVPPLIGPAFAGLIGDYLFVRNRSECSGRLRCLLSCTSKITPARQGPYSKLFVYFILVRLPFHICSLI